MLDINNFIDDVGELVTTKFEKDAQVIHIVLCFDDDYAMPAGVNIISIIENNKNNAFHFHLFSPRLSQSRIEKFIKINADNISITLYKVNENFQVSQKNTSSFPISACIRLIAPLFFKNLDYILYLDSDTLCIGDLGSIQKNDISDKIAGVVADVEKMQLSRCEQFDIPYGTYFNSGMMYINTRLWAQFKITEQALSLLNSTTHYKFPDQDVLNILLKDNSLLLDRKFNNIVELSVKGQEDSKLPHNAIIIHYVTGNKPWYKLYLTPTYNKYLSLSPWRNDKLLLANENAPSTTRRYAKVLASQHKYLAASKYYFLYLKHKLSKK